MMNLVKSLESSFPEVDAKTFLGLMTKGNHLPKGKVENVFIRATRNDVKIGLRSALSRGEFVEGVLRCAKDWVATNHPSCLVSDYIDDFFNLIIIPEYELNTILPLRKLIR